MEKKCSACQTMKPIDQFYKNAAMKDGHSHNCMECTRRLRNEYHDRKGRVTAKKYIERKMLNPTFVETFKKQNKDKQTRYRLNNSLKIKARQAIFIALRAGTIVKPLVCDLCRRPLLVEAHHWHGYTPDKWLDVVWACGECHNQFEKHKLPDQVPE
jgi:hypothetical protein